MYYVFDIETDGFNPTKIWCLSVKDKSGRVVSTSDYDKMRQFFSKPTWFVGHNIFAFDIPVVERLLGIDVQRARCIDTLYLSWALFPKRKGHALDDWDPTNKVQIGDWDTLSVSEYIKRCEADVEINWNMYQQCKEKLIEIYGKKGKLKQYMNYLSFKANCASRAEQNGWTLDKQLAKQNLKLLTTMRDERYEKLKQEMPPTPVLQLYKRPLQFYKKDDTLTQAGERWFLKCKTLGLDPVKTERLMWKVKEKEPNPGSVPQIKDWLFSLGWKPDEYKTNKQGKRVPQVNTQDNDRKGELSASVYRLRDKAPAAIDALEDLSILSHRCTVLTGFLEQVRADGRIPARIGGLTNTLRFQHSGSICNLPGMGSKFGEYVRPCLIAAKGKKLMGADVASLEDRTKQHYLFPHDPAYVKSMMVEGFDPHLDLALFNGALTQEQVDRYKRGEAPEIKPIRYKYKTGNYTCTYGAGADRIAEALGCSVKEAKVVHEAYWERNWAIRTVASNCKVMTTHTDEQDWLYNPVSGFWYELRHQKDRFSTLNQGTGSYAFDVWLGYVLTALGNRGTILGQFHDEFVFEVDYKEDEKELTQLVKDAMSKTNRVLKLNRELDCDVQFGLNYGEIH